MQWDALDAGDYRRLVDNRVRKQIRFQIYAYSPFYRRALDEAGIQVDQVDGLEDLADLPFVDRLQLSESSDEFVLAPTRTLIQRWGSGKQLGAVTLDKLLRGVEEADRNLRNDYDPVHLLETSGFSGEPIPIRLSRRDLAVLSTQGSRSLQVAGVGPEDVILNLLEPSSAGGFWSVWLGAVALGTQHLSPGFLEPESAANLARKMGSTVLIGLASDVLDLLEAGHEQSTLRIIILAPQAVSPSLIERIGEAAGREVKIISTYYFAEGRTLWAECFEGAGHELAGYHTFPDFDLFEAVQPSSTQAARQGETAELVYTGLDQRGTAVVHYRPSDAAAGGIRKGRCPFCGRICDRIVGPIRRAGDLLGLVLGDFERARVDKTVVAEILAHPRVRTWQVEISRPDGDPRALDEVVVLFDPTTGADPGPLAEELNELFVRQAGFSPTQFVVSTRGNSEVVDLRTRAVELV